jgi:hypothetical protein
MNATSTGVERATLPENTSENSRALERMEAEFARVLRAAVANRKFGQFGVIVSLQSGHVKTYQTHAVETLK